MSALPPRTLATGLLALLGLMALVRPVGAAPRVNGPDAQRLRPASALDDQGVATPSARPAWDRPWHVGLLLDHADDPVLVKGPGPDPAPVIDSQTTLHLLGAWNPWPRFVVGLEVPLILRQAGAAPGVLTDVASGSANGVAVGDLRAIAGFTLLTTETRKDPRGLSVGVQGEAFAPTGDETRYQGEGLRAEVRAVADLAFTPRLSVGGAAGYRFRHADRLQNVKVNDDFTYAAAAHVGVLPWLEIVPEAAGAVSVLTGTPDREEAPLEALLSARFQIGPNLGIHVGGGAGVVGGFGIPRVRGLLGLTWRQGDDPAHRARSVADDAPAPPVDLCPEAAEDFDGFQDDDGCPDLDDDADGVPDVQDDCRLAPEDKDGFEDADGCPDPDNDRDGIPDAVDRCPLDPEDNDGVADTDGCPDVDDDADAVPDRTDLCPAVAETKNDFRDTDGCPDEKPIDIDCKGFTLGGDVLFESGKITLLAASLPLLDKVARTLNEMPEIRRIRLEGYTDDVGPAQGNLELSQARVDEVRRHLLAQGVTPERLDALGRGEENPAVPNTTPAGRARNRRVEFVVVDREGCEGP